MYNRPIVSDWLFFCQISFLCFWNFIIFSFLFSKLLYYLVSNMRCWTSRSQYTSSSLNSSFMSATKPQCLHSGHKQLTVHLSFSLNIKHFIFTTLRHTHWCLTSRILRANNANQFIAPLTWSTVHIWTELNSGRKQQNDPASIFWSFLSLREKFPFEYSAGKLSVLLL